MACFVRLVYDTLAPSICSAVSTLHAHAPFPGSQPVHPAPLPRGDALSLRRRQAGRPGPADDDDRMDGWIGGGAKAAVDEDDEDDEDAAGAAAVFCASYTIVA